MLPILDREQLRALDAATIINEPIASVDLMERAAVACTDRLEKYYPDPSIISFVAICGMGNNGGDGLAIARLLHQRGYRVRVVLCRFRPSLSADAAVNLKRLRETTVLFVEAEDGSGPINIAESEVVLDALLGSGLDRPVEGWLKQLIAQVNAASVPVISIDVPSGLFTEDNGTGIANPVVRADRTLTFETPKLAFLLPENARVVGMWEVLSIGLDLSTVKTNAMSLGFLERSDVAVLMPDRPRFGHKGTFGHALLIAGAWGKSGAALLSAKAAVRSGAGLITAHVPADLVPLVHSVVPEAMVSMDPGTAFLERLPALAPYSAIGIGPGIGTTEETGRVVKFLLQEARVPLVFDADAINLLSENRTWFAFLPKGSILTPHPGEFDRMAGASTSGYERLRKAREMAGRNGIIVVLKGACTAICAPRGQVFFNSTGGPGMAKGGMGDALTGVITGLLAQGMDPLSATILGVYAHGLAGDLAAEEVGADGMCTSDLIERLPKAWRLLRESA